MMGTHMFDRACARARKRADRSRVTIARTLKRTNDRSPVDRTRTAFHVDGRSLKSR
jgi:hypothetical protein